MQELKKGGYLEAKTLLIERIFRQSWKSFLLGFVMVMVMQVANLLNFHPLKNYVGTIHETAAKTINILEDTLKPKFI